MSWSVAVVCAAALLILTGFPASSLATGRDGSAGLTVLLLPSTMVLQAGEVASVEVILENATRDPVRVTAVEVLAPARTRASGVSPSMLGVVAPRTSVRGRFQVEAAIGFETGDIAVLVEWRPSTTGDAARLFASAGLKATSGNATTAPELTIVSAPKTMKDGQERSALVRLANPTPFAFEQVAVVALSGEDLDVSLGDAPESPFQDCSLPKVSAPGDTLTCLALLEPGAAHILSIRLTAKDRVRTGDQRVSILLTGNRTRAIETESVPPSIAIATVDVSLTVFGVDALSPFGLGTLFLLPGVLGVVVFLGLARWVYPRNKNLADTVSLTDLRLLPIIAPIAALAYAGVWFVLGYDLTDAIGTIDVVVLFLLGIGFGLSVWAMMAAIWYRRIGRKQFSVEDSLETVLKRLAAQRSRLTRPVVTVNALPYCFLALGDDGKMLVTPPMSYTYAEATSEIERTAFRVALRKDDVKSILGASRQGQVALRGGRVVAVSEGATADEAPLLTEA